MAGQEAALVIEAYRSQFETAASVRVYRAPGRVNLIGEHTDYNLGFVLPIAMDLACFTATAPASDGMLRVHSRNLDETREWPVREVPELRPEHGWTDYVIGVAQQLHKLGYELQPMNIAIHSTVPVGSGLSSSAAIEVSSALALLNGRSIDRKELALLAQRAEREFVGMPSGIMDQYVSVFGEAGKVIRIDCRSVTHESAPLPDGVAILAVNSLVKHELSGSEYPVRVKQCAEAVEAIRKSHPEVTSLRDVSSDVVERLAPTMPEVVYRRARHVTTEDERVVRFVKASQDGDLNEMGRLFLASHRSLQYDYEVSAEELDFLADTASELTGVYGARMTGGGFGGCTVNLVAPDSTDAFRQHISEAYERAYRKVPEIYDCVPAEGAGEVRV